MRGASFWFAVAASLAVIGGAYAAFDPITLPFRAATDVDSILAAGSEPHPEGQLVADALAVPRGASRGPVVHAPAHRGPNGTSTTAPGARTAPETGMIVLLGLGLIGIAARRRSS